MWRRGRRRNRNNNVCLHIYGHLQKSNPVVSVCLSSNFPNDDLMHTPSRETEDECWDLCRPGGGVEARARVSLLDRGELGLTTKENELVKEKERARERER